MFTAYTAKKLIFDSASTGNISCPSCDIELVNKMLYEMLPSNLEMLLKYWQLDRRHLFLVRGFCHILFDCMFIYLTIDIITKLFP
jgi:hypothetical protein